jgi:WD40 repeat protein
MGHTPRVAIWEAQTCKTRFVVPELQLHSVAALAFSNNNELLAVVNNDKDHTISVYDWKANVAVCKCYAGGHHVLGVVFWDRDAEGSELGPGVSGPGLVSFGVQEIRFWRGVGTRFPTSLRPRLGEKGLLQGYLCGQIFAGRPVIGTSDGFLYVFNDTELVNTAKGHAAALTAMDVCAAKKWLVTGGKDGSVRVWTADMSCIKEFVLDSLLESMNPAVRSVAFNAAGTNLVVGTRGAEIFELSVASGAKVGERCLVEGHGMRQLWGLSSHPTREECVTTGDDATLRCVLLLLFCFYISTLSLI